MSYAPTLQGAAHHGRSFVGDAEEEAARVIRGVLLGCALSLPFWAAIGLTLHAALR